MSSASPWRIPGIPCSRVRVGIECCFVNNLPDATVLASGRWRGVACIRTGALGRSSSPLQPPCSPTTLPSPSRPSPPQTLRSHPFPTGVRQTGREPGIGRHAVAGHQLAQFGQPPSDRVPYALLLAPIIPKVFKGGWSVITRATIPAVVTVPFASDAVPPSTGRTTGFGDIGLEELGHKMLRGEKTKILRRRPGTVRWFSVGKR